MSIFDSIISENGEKFNLGDKSGALLSALLGLISDRSRGGLTGFLNRFREAGLGDVADSWVSAGDNTTLSGEQVESALGSDAVSEISGQAGIQAEIAKPSLGLMIPGVIDRLTPDGVVPDETILLSTIGNHLTGFGRPANAGAENTVDRIGSAAGTTADRATDEFNQIDNVNESDDSILKWLIPLILLGLLIAVGWAFCRKSETPPPANANTNSNVNKLSANNNGVAKIVDSSFRIETQAGKTGAAITTTTDTKINSNK